MREKIGPPQQPEDIFGQFVESIKDPSKRVESDKLFPALNGSIRGLILSNRTEIIDPIVKQLDSATGQLRKEQPLTSNAYFLGRMDGLLDLLRLASDRSLSEKIIELVGRSVTAQAVITELSREGEEDREIEISQLAEKIGGISKGNLVKVLKWTNQEKVTAQAQKKEDQSFHVKFGPKGKSMHDFLVAKGTIPQNKKPQELK